MFRETCQVWRVSFYYVNPQERKPQAQRDWLDLLQGRAHNVHKVDVCALSFLCKSPRAQAAGAARLQQGSCDAWNIHAIA